MAILYDSRGNEIKAFPDFIGGETFTDGRTISSVLGALNAEVIMDLYGCQVARFDVRSAAGNLSFIFEGSIDGVNYFPLPAFAENSLVAAAISAEVYVGTVVVATTITANYTVGVSGLRRIRIRVSAYTSGNITVSARASIADLIIYQKPIPTTLWITVTAAANTIATATLPSAGAGLFHYITSILMMRNATAALVGTATLIHTSTNLAGNPAWSVGNAMVAGGTQTDVNMTFSNPIKSLLAATATTLVMPAAGAAVLNRINVGYYIGA